MALNCIAHGHNVIGVSFTCPKCKAVYCLEGVKNVLLETGQCVTCATEIEDMEEFKFFVSKDHLSQRLSSIKIKIGSSKTGKVKEVIEDANGSIKKEIVYKMNSVPRDKRVKFLEIYLEKLNASLF
ncbi:MAG: hypothetical protein ACFFCS_15780 [Candidatus Hodarchaeota archaeon]